MKRAGRESEFHLGWNAALDSLQDAVRKEERRLFKEGWKGEGYADIEAKFYGPRSRKDPEPLAESDEESDKLMAYMRVMANAGWLLQRIDYRRAHPPAPPRRKAKR